MQWNFFLSYNLGLIGSKIAGMKWKMARAPCPMCENCRVKLSKFVVLAFLRITPTSNKLGLAFYHHVEGELLQADFKWLTIKSVDNSAQIFLTNRKGNNQLICESCFPQLPNYEYLLDPVPVDELPLIQEN